MKSTFKESLRSQWESRSINSLIVMNFLRLDDPVLRSAWDISDEQHQRIRASFQTGINDMREKNPEIRQLMDELITSNMSGAFFAEDADEATMVKIREMADKVPAAMTHAAAEAVNDVLTPEQRQKIKESQLANMGTMPVLSPNIFEALNLTDAQKQQMGDIKKELDPEFEKALENFADRELALWSKVVDRAVKAGKADIALGEDEPVRKMLMAEDPEFRKIQDELQSQSQAFAEKFRIKMFDVLTDEQWARLLELIDNPPEHALIFGKRLRERHGENAQAGQGGWQPGPGAWQPGDPIPEGYRIQRETRRQFPRGEE